MSPSSASESRPLVLLVGRDSRERSEVAGALIAHGHAVVLCAGPPACALVREDRCVLTQNADATVVLPRRSTERTVETGLTLCVRASHRAIVVEPAVVAPAPPGAVVLSTQDPEAVATAVELLLSDRLSN